MARGDDLVLKVTADTSQVAAGLKGATSALDTMEKETGQATKALKDLDKQKVQPEIELTLEARAIQRAKDKVKALRDQMAQDILIGADTREAQRQIATLQTSIRKLEAEKPKVIVDVESDPSELNEIREGAAETARSLGDLQDGMSGVASVGGSLVPLLGDMNEKLRAYQAAAAAAGRTTSGFSRALTTVSGIAAGPWGIALAAAVGILAAFSDEMFGAEDSVQDFTDALDAQAGAMNKANREAVAKRLADEGVLKVMKDQGVNLQDVISATLGQAGAQERVNVQLAQARARIAALTGGTDSQGYKLFNEMLTSNVDKMGEIQGAYGITEEKQRLMAEAIGPVTDELKAQGKEAEDNADAWEGLADKVDDARAALDDALDSMNALNGKFVDVRQAQRDYQEALDSTTEAIKENGKTLDITTEKGRNNDQAMQEQAETLADLTEARLRDAVKSGQSTTEIEADYKKQRDALVDTAEQLLGNRTEAEAYVTEMLGIPPDVKTNVDLTGVEAAKTELDEVTRERTVWINLRARYSDAELRRLLKLETTGGSYDTGAGGGGFGGGSGRSAGATLLQPRIYLDSVPIAAVLHSTVVATATSTALAATTRGRL